MSVLHGALSNSAPTQFLPPNNGNGLVHVLILSFSPPVHVDEHCDQVLHTPQPPSTTITLYVHVCVTLYVYVSATLYVHLCVTLYVSVCV